MVIVRAMVESATESNDLEQEKNSPDNSNNKKIVSSLFFAHRVLQDDSSQWRGAKIDKKLVGFENNYIKTLVDSAVHFV